MNISLVSALLLFLFISFSERFGVKEFPQSVNRIDLEVTQLPDAMIKVIVTIKD